MIYLRCKCDMISVPFIREAYIICEATIILKIHHPFRKERISLQKPSFVRQTKEGFCMERGTGIEPASSAWEADVLPMY